MKRATPDRLNPYGPKVFDDAVSSPSDERTAPGALTEVETVVVEQVLAGASPADAGQAAGLESRQAGAAVMQRPQVRDALNAALEAEGLTLQHLVRRVREGTDAVKPLGVVDAEGRALAVPDHGVRHKFVQTGLELHGLPDRRAPVEEETWESLILEIHRASRRAPDPPATPLKGS